MDIVDNNLIGERGTGSLFCRRNAAHHKTGGAQNPVVVFNSPSCLFSLSIDE
jgi:hypothetical protein